MPNYFRTLTCAFALLLGFSQYSLASPEDSSFVLQSLPPELISEVMGYLDPQSLSRLMATNSYFFELGENDRSWKNRIVILISDTFKLDSPAKKAEFERVKNNLKEYRFIDFPGFTGRDIYIFLHKIVATVSEHRKIELKPNNIVKSIQSVPEILSSVANATSTLSRIVLKPEEILELLVILGAGPELANFYQAAVEPLSVSNISTKAIVKIGQVTAVPFVLFAGFLYGYSDYQQVKRIEDRAALSDFKESVWEDFKRKFGDQAIPIFFVDFRKFIGV